MDKDIEKRITDLIGENLDRLITIDWRCQGQIHPLYQAARDTSDGPLAMRAAQEFVHKIKEKMVAPETDGVVAASLIARAVDLGFKAKPVVFCEEECVDIAKACCAAAGLRIFDDFKTSILMPHTVTVLPFTKDAHKAGEEAKRILDEMKPRAAVSIERQGRNEKGFYHMANGLSITDFVAKIDELFEGVGKRGA